MKQRGRWRRLLPLVAVLPLLAYAGKMGYSVLRWDAEGWFPGYLASRAAGGDRAARAEHLVFVMADHYEPGKGADGAAASRRWLEAFRAVASRHRDDDGRPFRYTWFYPYDHRNAEVLAQLNAMAREGFGEVELHWHHPAADSTTFPAMLAEALAWFREHGALIASDSIRSTQYAFVHGNWALDGSTPRCGVTNEIELLRRSGCYADLTFATIGTPAQPRRINSLYYATDGPAPKSHDDGEEASVGRRYPNGFLILQGPLGVDFGRAALEYGAVESYHRPSRRRASLWIDTGIQVRGRPEWIFVKVYTHGAGSARALFDEGGFDTLLEALRAECEARGLRLHFMTAREAVNVVRAAEAGETGDPGRFRDYALPPPLNALPALPEVPAGG